MGSGVGTAGQSRRPSAKLRNTKTDPTGLCNNQHMEHDRATPCFAKKKHRRGGMAVAEDRGLGAEDRER